MSIYCTYFYQAPLTLFSPVLDCGQPPAVVNGEIEFTTTTVGSKAIYSCEAGRHHIGEVVLECLDSGEWSGVPPLCLGKLQQKNLSIYLCKLPTCMNIARNIC